MKSLRPALKNLLLFLIALGIVLFASAGTLRFIAGWVYLALLGVLSLAVTLYLAIYDEALLQRRLKAGPAAEQQTSQKLIQIAASLLLFAVLVIAGLDHRFHWSAMSRSAIVTADIVFALSFLLILVVFRANTFTSGVIEVAEDQRVISTGPYAIVRHPMYTGGMLFLLATPVALASWWGLIPAALLCVVVVVRLLDEERFLIKNLPGYAEYRHRVRWRLVPGVW